MQENEGPADFDETRAEIFEAISHPARIRILQALNDKPMGFAELGRAVGIEGGGHLGFHLRKLSSLVKMSADGRYALTGDGKEALWSVNALRKASNGARPSQTSVRHRSWSKPILAGVLFAVIVLGGVSYYQQQQVSAQQRQIDSLRIGQALSSASIAIGQFNFNSYSSATSRSGLYWPEQALFDSAGNLWVTDTHNNRVLEFKSPFSTGMQATLVIGQQNFTANHPGIPDSSCSPKPSCLVYSFSISGSTMVSPAAGSFDSSGNLWVVDTGDNRVLEFKPPFVDGMSAIHVIGQKNLIMGGSGDSAGQLDIPNGIVFDSSGNLWILDAGNNRVLEFVRPFTDGMNASLVIGQPNFQERNPATTRTGLNSTEGDLAFDRDGNLWVADAQNGRILEFSPPFATGMGASLVLGQSDFTTAGKSNPACTVGPGTIIYAFLDFDIKGNLWVSSDCNLLLYRFPFTTGSQPTFELNGGGEAGAYGFAPSSGQKEILTGPGKVVFDASGNLWVPDVAANRVLEFSSVEST